jgi:hypothetical protein
MTGDVLAARASAQPLRSQPVPATGSAADDALRALLCLSIATLVFEGPLRWAGALSGWANLIYLRDAIPVGSVVFLFARSLLLRGWLDVPVAAVTSVLILHALVALVLGLAPFQVAFGLKTFMYLLYGMAMWPLLQDRWPALLRVAAGVWAVSLAGVALDFAIGPFPWEGLEYETAFGAAHTTWRWWIADGIPRLPGFARSSFNAAMILGISGALTLIRLRRPWSRAIVVALTFAGIAATTSKGMLLAFPLAAAWLVYPAGAGQARTGRWLIHSLCALGLVLPLAMVLLGIGTGLRPDDWPELSLTAWERFSRVWPEAFELLPSGIAGLLGGGLGSIGTPQLFGLDPHRFNPGDSVAVFLLVNFGVAGALYYLLPALMLRRVAAVADDGVARAYAALLIIGYGYGISISMLEEMFFAIALGLALGAAFKAIGSRPARP